MTDSFIQDVYSEVTVMTGPGVDGRADIKFGRHTKRREINEAGELVIVESVAERKILPEPMDDEEISEWLENSEEGQQLLKRHGWNGETDD